MRVVAFGFRVAAAGASNASTATSARKSVAKAGALDDRDTRLRNVAHPGAPARGPSRSPGIASTTASGRAPVEAPTGKVVGQPHHRGSCRAGPLRGERCDRSPRGGSPGHRCPISLLHIGSLHNAITASSSTRSSARYERASAKGQPHSAAADTQDPRDALLNPRHPSTRGMSTTRRWMVSPHGRAGQVAPCTTRARAWTATVA